MLIIFDFDGVLRSISWEGIYGAYIEILRFKGKDHKEFFPDLQSFKKWFDSDYKKNLNKIVEIKHDDVGAGHARRHRHRLGRQCLDPGCWLRLRELSSRH